MTPIRINITREQLSSETPLEWIARAYLGQEYLAVGFGPTQLAAFRSLLTSLERQYPEPDPPAIEAALEES